MADGNELSGPDGKTRKKKALVTGGLGFIGSHLVDRLLDRSWEVVVLDNLSTGHRANLAHRADNPDLRITEGDIRDIRYVSAVTVGCDAVFHLAAHAMMRVSPSNRKTDLDNNLLGTLNVIESMINHGVCHLLLASTSALYGEAGVVPTPEHYLGTQTSLYGAAKLAAEAYASAYTQFSPLQLWSFRFGTVLGERCRRGAVWDFTHKLRLTPAVLEILGNGQQKKDYLHVADCVDGIMTGYDRASDRVNIFNLGLEEQTSVDELADIVIAEMGLTDVTRRYTGGEHGWVGDNPVVYLSAEKLRSLGWRPAIPPREAIRLTARWTIGQFNELSDISSLSADGQGEGVTLTLNGAATLAPLGLQHDAGAPGVTAGEEGQ
jgi:UDP-glucose 4-epimerase